jgi:raffinose/stachyose/melibiose transport system permease protein
LIESQATTAPLRRSRFLSARRGRSRRESTRVAYLFLLPALIAYTLFAIVPIVHTILLSLFRWDGVTALHWVGLDNFAAVLSDPVFQQSLTNAVLFIPFYTLLPLAIGLALVVAMTRSRIRGRSVFRTLLFLPYTLSLVVVAVAWGWMFDVHGTIDSILNAVGLSGLIRPWLGDFFWALPSLGVMGAWVWYGLAMVLFMAGVQRIPRELYDAARIDGAGPVRELLSVTLPGIRNEVAVVVTLAVISALRNFDLVFVATRGGPGNATTTPALLMYVDAFQNGLIGQGAAIAVVLTILSLAAILGIQRLLR